MKVKKIAKLKMTGPNLSEYGLENDVIPDMWINATELADYLVSKDIPFREAHHIVGVAVVGAIEKGCALEELSIAELQTFSSVIEEDVYAILTIESCLAKRNALGGVAPEQVAFAIEQAQSRLK